MSAVPSKTSETSPPHLLTDVLTVGVDVYDHVGVHCECFVDATLKHFRQTPILAEGDDAIRSGALGHFDSVIRASIGDDQDEDLVRSINNPWNLGDTVVDSLFLVVDWNRYD